MTGERLGGFGGEALLARRGRGPLYLQVTDDLSARVADGRLNPGQRLPSEAELAAAYQVNRLTVRRALSELCRAGVLRVEHGVGTFVASPAMRHRIDGGRLSLLESMSQRDIPVRRVVLGAERLDSPTLGGPEEPGFRHYPGAVMRFRYVAWIEEQPWSLSTITVPAILAPHRAWDGSQALVELLESDHQVKLRRFECSFAAVPADSEDSRHLEVPVGTPLLRVGGSTVDDVGNRVATTVHRARGDRAEYFVTVPEARTP